MSITTWYNIIWIPVWAAMVNHMFLLNTDKDPPRGISFIFLMYVEAQKMQHMHIKPHQDCPMRRCFITHFTDGRL